MAFRYDVVTVNRIGHEHVHRSVQETALAPGAIVRLNGRDWLIERIEPGDPDRAFAKPARYRIRLRRPDGREEAGAFRRYRPGAPALGHGFTTLEDGQPTSWEIVEERLERDAAGEPYVDLVAQRDYAEAEGDLPDHELEHALAAEDGSLPEAATETLSRAEAAGLAVELAALDAGEEPDWAAAARFIDALILEEVEDDLLEQCGVDPRSDPREHWLAAVQERLRADLTAFRADVEGGHEHIEEWDFRDGRIFASMGTIADESDPNSGHGWLCRLLDSSALAAAGFVRVRKAELVV